MESNESIILKPQVVNQLVASMTFLNNLCNFFGWTHSNSF